MYRKDFTIGHRIGTRIVIEQMEERKDGYVVYKTRCDCGKESIVKGSYLRLSGKGCRSCSTKLRGKKGSEHYSFKHGMSSRLLGKDKLYCIWVSMRQRCRDKNDKRYKDYGGRGISVCEEWEDFSKFLSDMGYRPKGFQIERKNNNGNYCKENCRWASIKEQQNNKRTTVFYIVNGKKIARQNLIKKLKITVDKFRHLEERKGIDWILNNFHDQLDG